ncbi:MAG: spermine synthase [Thermodesulfobacteriota bacterium]
MSIIIYFLFTLSGFIALIYESTWSRYLRLFLGHSAYGQILTLCIFMGGLGIGALIAGRYAKRLRNPLYCYSILELLIGLGGLLYHNAYLLVTNFFYSLSFTYSPSPIISDVLRVALSTLVTGPIAVLIGMTFPILAIGLMRLVKDLGKTTLSRLYFTNSLGAAIGIMVTSYVLIPGFGTIGSLMIAGSGNLIIALCFLFISKKVRGDIDTYSFDTRAPTIEIDGDPTNRPSVLIWLSISFLTGFSSFLYEIGWLRLVSMLLGSSTHSFDIMVSAFIFGLAIGGLLAKTLLYRSKNIPHTLAAVQTLMGASAIISIYLSNLFFELVRDSNNVLLRTESSYYIFSVFKYILCLLLLFPTSFFAGMTLPLITYFLINLTQDEKYTGSVYGWNTIGAILGAALGGLLVLPILQLKFTLASGALIDVAIGLILFWMYRSSKLTKSLAIGSSFLIMTPVLFFHFNSFLITTGVFRSYYKYEPDEKVTIRDGKTATVSFHEIGDRKYIKTNGKFEASLSTTEELAPDETAQAAPAFIPMAMVNRPYNAAMIGLGSGMTAHFLLGDPLLKHLDLIEIEKEFYYLAKGFMPYNKRAYKDERIKFVFDDARRFFYTGQKKYDMIISQPSNPWVSGVSSLFTEEFYRAINRFLKPDGLLVQWLQLYEFNSTLFFVILKAIDNVFPYVKIYDVQDGGNIVIVASKTDFSAKFYDRFRNSEQILRDLHRFSGKINFLSNTNYVISTQSLKAILEDYNPNSDYFPIVDNGAEKAFFLRKYVEVLSPFKNSVFYYQEVLEPDQFSETLKQLLIKQSNHKPDLMKMNYLLTILRTADSHSDWKSIENLFNDLFPIELLRGLWNNQEAVELFRDHVLKKNPPYDIRLKFQFLDYAINNEMESLKEIIPLVIAKFNKDSIPPQIIRAIAIQCYKMNNYDLFEALNNKFVEQNKEISKEEKMLLDYMGKQIKDSKDSTTISIKDVTFK